MTAYLLAGGKGTRLSAVTKNEIPKPMAVIAGKPIIEHIILALKSNGITDFILSVGYLHEKIEEYVGNGEKWGVNVTYVVENEPLGSGGALYYVKGKIKEDFLVCPADDILDIDLERMLAYHKAKNALITLFVHPNLHPYDSDLVFADKSGRVTEFNLKNTVRDFDYKNNVNAGLFFIAPEALEWFCEPKKVNMEHDFINALLPTGRVFAYRSPEYIKDVGTPERFAMTERDMAAGIPQKRNLRNKQKAIFLDRDGTINEFKGYIKDPDEIVLLPKAADAIKAINASEYLAIIVSNQPIIARGDATFAEVDHVFERLETLLGKEGAYIDGIYYCPHHPKKGFPGEVAELKIDCDCRKPKTGMLERAATDFNLDLTECFIIGDSEFDMKTAENASIPGILVPSEMSDKCETAPTYSATDLLDAVNYILSNPKR